MINTSNEYKQAILKNRQFKIKSQIVFKDGSMLFVEKLRSNGLRIEESVSSPNSFDIGAAIMNQCTLVIDNVDDAYSTYDFEGAELSVEVGLVLKSGIEFLKKGKYTLQPGSYTGSAITLKGLDNMSKFDKPYSLSQLKYPATLGQITRDACEICGVPLGSATFENDDYIVKTRPDDKALTFRQVLLWIGQIICKWWKCDVYGNLVCGWYDTSVFEQKKLDGGVFDDSTPYASGDKADGGNFTDYSSGDVFDGGNLEEMKRYHHIYSIASQNICTDDVVITGVRVTEYIENEGQIYQDGEEGYVLSVENNKFIQEGDGEKVARELGYKLIGLRFRPLSVSCLSDPSIEAGDVAYVTDRKQNAYQCFITNTTFTVGSYQQISCDAKTPGRNSATRYSQSTQAYVELRKEIKEEQTQRELAIKDLANKLATSSGLYTTEEKQGDGSTIYYAHNKPTLDESDIVWKFTAEAIGISNDGGKTWPYGFTVTGSLITKILQTEGVNADWIRTGSISVKDKTGKEIFLVDMDTGAVRIDADSLSIKGKNVTTVITEMQNFTVSNVEPENKEKIWCDTSEEPSVFRKWNGQEWTIVNDQTEIVNTVYRDIYKYVDDTGNGIITTVGSNYYKKGEVDELLNSISTTFEQYDSYFEMKFNESKEQIDGVEAGANEKFQNFEKYIRFIDGTIILGQVDDAFQLQIKRNRISFLENEREIAYIADRKIYITDGEFLNSLTVGIFALRPRKNGNLSFGKVRERNGEQRSVRYKQSVR